MKHTLHIFSGLLLAGTLMLGSCGESQQQDSKEIAEEKNDTTLTTKASEKDAQLAVDVVASNYAEVALAKTAQQKSSNAEIKDIAGMLENDHTALIGQFKDYAAKNSVALPTEITPEAQKDVNDLADAKPADFDKKWCNELLDKHEATIKKLEGALNDISDASLKTLVTDALPKIRMHRDKLMECKNKMK